MSTVTTSPGPGFHAGAGRLRVWRYLVGYAAIVATVPYLTLKTIWLAGGTTGITDPAFASDTSLVVLNGVTAGMDVVAVLVALTFTHSWGMRVPAWLILPPMWVGTGLLLPIALAAPLAGFVGFVSGDFSGVTAGPLPLEPWVQPLVYGGFACQGVLLGTAFVLYASVRWGRLLTGAVVRDGATRGLQVVLGYGLAPVALAVGATRLGLLAGPDPVSRLVGGAHALLALLAGIGMLGLLYWRGRRYWVPLALTWCGAAAMFSWGAWSMVQVLGTTALAGTPDAAHNMLAFVQLITGLLLGLTSLILLTERAAVSPRR